MIGIAPGRGATASTLATIRRYYNDFQYELDPHTAVGVYGGEQHRGDGERLICLATAHPAKFSKAIRDAIGRDVTHPILEQLKDAPTRSEVLPADERAVREYIAARALS